MSRAPKTSTELADEARYFRRAAAESVLPERQERLRARAALAWSSALRARVGEEESERITLPRISLRDAS